MTRKWWKEPLLHFLVAGAALFAVQSWASLGEAETIVVEPALVDALREQYEARAGQAPDRETLNGLIAQFVREEALYREARARGLDQGDPIVRRRLVQKLEYILQGEAEVAPPDDQTLATWLEERAAEYTAPKSTTFTHVFFSRTRHGEEAGSVAQTALEELRSLAPVPERAPQRGDPFTRGHDFTSRADEDVDRIFGSGFATRLNDTPIGEWYGPIESTYGVHLVRVEARAEPNLPSLDVVRPRITQDWLIEHSEASYRQALEDVLAKYPVERP